MLAVEVEAVEAVEAGMWRKLFAGLVGSLFVTRIQSDLGSRKSLPSINFRGHPHLLVM